MWRPRALALWRGLVSSVPSTVRSGVAAARAQACVRALVCCSSVCWGGYWQAHCGFACSLIYGQCASVGGAWCPAFHVNNIAAEAARHQRYPTSSFALTKRSVGCHYSLPAAFNFSYKNSAARAFASGDTCHKDASGTTDSVICSRSSAHPVHFPSNAASSSAVTDFRYRNRRMVSSHPPAEGTRPGQSGPYASAVRSTSSDACRSSPVSSFISCATTHHTQGTTRHASHGMRHRIVAVLCTFAATPAK